jgi:hypothetical protein
MLLSGIKPKLGSLKKKSFVLQRTPLKKQKDNQHNERDICKLNTGKEFKHKELLADKQ